MKRLKIAEQIVIVMLLAVLIPFVTIGLIISNISQQSVRKELIYSSKMISGFVGDSVQNYIKLANEELRQVASAISFFYYEDDKNDFLDEIQQKYGKFSNFKVLDSDTLKNRDPVFNVKNSTIKLYADISSTDVVSADLKMAILQDALDNKFSDIKHDIYILDGRGNIVATNDHDNNGYQDIVKNLPKERQYQTPVLFSKVKNQPLAYFQLENPEWTIIVKTTPVVTKKTIDMARFRIILSLVLAALFIFAIVGIYTYYLYLNIRQLFKGIIAISKGSYNRKIRLLKSVFTPHEIVFLEKEFNYMTKKVAGSYAELSEKNLELKRLDEFRGSLISAVSHEFRTPLTSIIGYSSRLLRSDIKIDESTKTKSLKVIKQQAQRLSRMVDDLLVVPDIESFKLQLNTEKLDLAKLLELSVTYANSNDTKFEINMAQDLIPVEADKDRLIQVLVNLCDNAIKYNKDGAPIVISAANVEGKPCLSILNKADIIPKEMIKKLYDKFVRIDSELTKTTRGTGLGLYIVKGLCEAMNITIDITSTEAGFEVVLVFNNAPKAKENPFDFDMDTVEELNEAKSEMVNTLFS
ncbi:MAG: ATP-binding protein [Candidatus Gastranaerophilales bacterium]|nr:ATP-binding protein [Candidatus Gastranaerophilales bacterium]